MLWVPVLAIELYNVHFFRLLKLKEYHFAMAIHCILIRPEAKKKLLPPFLSGNINFRCCWKDGIKLVNRIVSQISFFHSSTLYQSFTISLSRTTRTTWQMCNGTKISRSTSDVLFRGKVKKTGGKKIFLKLCANKKTEQKTNSTNDFAVSIRVEWCALLRSSVACYSIVRTHNVTVPCCRCRKPKIYQSRFPFKIAYKICTRIFAGLPKDSIDIFSRSIPFTPTYSAHTKPKHNCSYRFRNQMKSCRRRCLLLLEKKFISIEFAKCKLQHSHTA